MQRIAHPTDLSAPSAAAFAHALRIAVEFRCELDILHAHPIDADDHWSAFPHVRPLLHRWGLLPAQASPDDILDRLGVTVRKVEVRDDDPVHGLLAYLGEHHADLLVLSTHGRAGVERWMDGSVSTDLARESHAPTLFIGPAARPFVDARTGAMHLRRIVAPIAPEPDPDRALRRLAHLFTPLAPQINLLHVGDRSDWFDADDAPPLELVAGGVVETIVARSRTADLIAMPTAGHHGFLDALRGSVSERVVRQAHCPVLTLAS